MPSPRDPEAEKKQWGAPLTYGIVIILALLLASWLLTITIGDECWFQRIGAVLVGIGIIVEAFALFEPGRAIVGFDAEGTEPVKMKTAIVCAAFGTVLWAFGDLLFRPFGFCPAPLAG
jgi:hypothetical protein